MKLTRHDTNKNLVRQKGREGRDFKVKFNALEPGHWNGKKDIGEDGSGTIQRWNLTVTSINQKFRWELDIKKWNTYFF